MSRRLHPEEHAVWGQVAKTVRPTKGRTVVPVLTATNAVAKRKLGFAPTRETVAPPIPVKRSVKTPSNTLDAGWDRRLSKGMVSPDAVIDLHGETLASAHARLNFALADAAMSGARLILLVTGKAARENPRLPPTSRGVIRASITDWLSSSPHASRIAAVRNAHPRHGGAGALYVVLRRAR